MIRFVIRASLGLSVAQLFGGCASAPQAVEVPTTSVCLQPSLNLVETEKPAMQRDGDIALLVAVDLPTCTEMVTVSHTRREPGLGEGLLGIMGASESTPPLYVRRREVRELLVDDDVGFEINVNNQSERVFRGQGMVVQYMVDGRSQAVDQSYVAGLVEALILPGQSRNIRIGGASLAGVNDGSTMALYMYDVVVERDPAGTATRRANFEWFFTTSSRRIEAPGSEKTCDQVLPGGRSLPEAYRSTPAALSADGNACP